MLVGVTGWLLLLCLVGSILFLTSFHRPVRGVIDHTELSSVVSHEDILIPNRTTYKELIAAGCDPLNVEFAKYVCTLRAEFCSRDQHTSAVSGFFTGMKVRQFSGLPEPQFSNEVKIERRCPAAIKKIYLERTRLLEAKRDFCSSHANPSALLISSGLNGRIESVLARLSCLALLRVVCWSVVEAVEAALLAASALSLAARNCK